MTSTPLRAFVHRDPRQCLLPGDVLEALDAPRHIDHGTIIVISTDPRSAWHELQLLGIEFSRAHRLVEAFNSDSIALLNSKYAHENAVFAMLRAGGDQPVVLLVPGVDERYVIHNLGIMRWQDGKSTLSSDEPVVTDDMVDAAYAVLPGRLAHEIESQLMRAAIAAALKAKDVT